jgi:type IV pilus assembly protein PilV
MPMNARGFSLVEVLIAMAIVTIGVLGGARLLGMGMVRSAQARKVTAAQHLANQVVERLRLEVRFDIEPAAGSGTSGGGEFTAENAWKAERLPYSSNDSVKPAAGASLETCDPPGAEDDPATDYNVGPLPFSSEGNRYWVCYRIEAPNTANCLADAACATVKVIWAEAGRYRAHRTLAFLASGR